MSADAAFTPAKRVLAQPVPDGLVVLNLETEAYYRLDASGANMWQLLSQEKPLDEIADLISQQFGAEKSLVLIDIAQLAEGLCAAGLMRQKECS